MTDEHIATVVIETNGSESKPKVRPAVNKDRIEGPETGEKAPSDDSEFIQTYSYLT